jgi:putative ATP-grasp target RiPP
MPPTLNADRGSKQTPRCFDNDRTDTHMTPAISAYPGFADDPFASHSAQFPLGAPIDRVSTDQPSSGDVRPWALRGMKGSSVAMNAARQYRYDHTSQTAVDDRGRPLIMAATANKVTNNDGDEGPSEDFTYDFVPDDPFQI